MPWILLLLASGLEVVWAVALQRSEGFTRLVPVLVGVPAAVLSFVLLTFAMRSLPIGTAYAVWVGLGTLGVVLAGMAALGESATPARLVCLGLILFGVVGLYALGG
jgi:Membrane transporters of cations and cationic drugs